MRFPNVLIIGAMKSGTTGLYMDLSARPQIYRAQDKEPHALCHDDTLTPAGQARYAANYAKATADQLCIDASTGYTKRPDYERVAQRACMLLPEDFKVIYVIRHPIERIISQHYHEYCRKEVGADINEAVRKHPRFINYSRYGYQLRPWVEAIGWERIKVVRFEDYANCRAQVIAGVCSFLGVPAICEAPDTRKVYNRSQGKPIRNRFWSHIYRRELYRHLIRPLLPVELRLGLQELVLPRAPEQPDPPSEETSDWLRSQLVEDIKQLEGMLGYETPFWTDLVAQHPTVGPPNPPLLPAE